MRVVFVLIVVVVCLEVVAGYKEIKSQCTCASSHPQQLFCDSHFALTGVVASEEPKTIYGTVINENGKPEKQKVAKMYEITVMRVFRGKEILLGIPPVEGKQAKDLPTFEEAPVEIYTPYDEEACGINLEFGVQYLIYGMRNNEDKLETKLCNFFAEWEYIEDQINRGVHGGYDCRCKVETGITLTDDQYDFNVTKNSTCVFNISPSELLDECAMNFLTCRKLVTPISGNGFTEMCVWIEGMEYENCRRDFQHVVDVAPMADHQIFTKN